MTAMRSFYWYDSDGCIRGRLGYQGGWPDGVGPADASPSDPVAAAQKAHFEALPDFAGWVEVNCDPCPAACEATGFCEDRDGCASLAQRKWWDGVALSDRLAVTWNVDGVDRVGQDVEITDIAAGTIVPVILKCPGIPDGTQGTIVQAKPFEWPVLLSGSLPLDVTFNSGETASFNIQVPAAGMKGGLWLDQVPAQWARLCIMGEVAA